ncbi:hypothetical protein MGWOODY_Smn1384 [hydrothermal vent metagenome]|uniref:Uncharacterized protein n=1 Tax=hydrothermal vent metagenome TaxID=652676 RepID=A0A160TIJ7_9ZZZZ
MGERGNGPHGDLPTIRLHDNSAIDYRVKYIAKSPPSNRFDVSRPMDMA